MRPAHFRRLKFVFVRLLAVVVLGWAFSTEARADSLQDPGFESDSEGTWSTRAWRGAPQEFRIVRDKKVKRSGSQSLKITNSVENDALYIQQVAVEPDTVYEVSGWIKTKGVAGTEGLKAQNIGASICLDGTWILSDNLKGDAPWTAVKFFVKTGTNQRTLPVACRLGYMGNTVKGTAWFDDLSVVPAPAPAGVTLAVYGEMAPPRSPAKMKAK